jgi:hypothetical protein
VRADQELAVESGSGPRCPSRTGRPPGLGRVGLDGEAESGAASPEEKNVAAVGDVVTRSRWEQST